MTDLLRTPVTAELLHGALATEPGAAGGLVPHRLPRGARALADGQLLMAESQTSGVRLSFRTRATVVELHAVPTRLAYAGAPARPEGVYELLVDRRVVAAGSVAGGRTMTIDMMSGESSLSEEQATALRFTGLAPAEKTVEIWLPWNEAAELVELRTDAPVHPVEDAGRRVWLHHGSSISHGSNSGPATSTWVATAALAGEVDPINLGFSGSALLDPFVARAMRDVPADLISIKLGINIVNADLMRLRAFAPAVHGFLDIIREGHPDTPILVISSIICPVHEATPGPLLPDLTGMAEGRLSFRAGGDPAEVAAGKLTLGVIRDELERIVALRAEADPMIDYLDGRTLYGAADHDRRPLPDNVHPDPETQVEMGTRFAALAFGPGGAFTVERRDDARG